MPDLIFLHGMESSPKGTKAQIIKKNHPHCVIPDLPPDIHLRQSILDRLITGPVCIVGSSLGGLSALLFAMKQPALVKGMILVAPAVGFYDHSIFNDRDKQLIGRTYIPAKIPCTVMIGKRDTVIPQADIEAMIDRSPDKSLIRNVYRNDDHTRNHSLERPLAEINRMLASPR